MRRKEAGGIVWPRILTIQKPISARRSAGKSYAYDIEMRFGSVHYTLVGVAFGNGSHYYGRCRKSLTRPDEWIEFDDLLSRGVHCVTPMANKVGYGARMWYYVRTSEAASDNSYAGLASLQPVQGSCT